MSLLVKTGCPIAAQDKYGATPLHRAASRGHLDIVKVLLSANASPNMADGEGNTPLHLAADEGHKKVFDELKRAGANPEIVNKEGKKAIDMVH